MIPRSYNRLENRGWNQLLNVKVTLEKYRIISKYWISNNLEFWKKNWNFRKFWKPDFENFENVRFLIGQKFQVPVRHFKES